ncbi:MAG: S8 family serine peptidase [Candidatus Kapaibacterium sp.]
MVKTIYRLIPLFLLTISFGCGDNLPFAAEEDQTPLLKPGDAIPNQYIVRLNGDVPTSLVPDVASDVAKAHTATVTNVYNKTVKGFSATMTSAKAAAMAADARVLSVEQDRVVALAPPPGKGKPGSGDGGGGTPTAQETPWGITEIGGSSDGTGGVVWILDSGIDLDHPDLNVDVARSRNFVSKGKDSPDDGNGHGTHVAGIIGALNNSIGVVGVAAGTTVISVRVLDNSGSGSYSGIIAGLDYVATNGTAGDVVNMSLGGPISASFDAAVLALADAGFHIAVAAGNDGQNASNESPAHLGNNHARIYTVSAHDQSGCLTLWSNYGLDVDYAAPGLNILSLWKGGGTNTISGTSMATPHVAGLLVLSSLNSSGTACNDRDGVPDPRAHK